MLDLPHESRTLLTRYTETPIAYYSGILRPTEQRHSQIDEEALGIETGVEKFFAYLFGRRFTLITNSRPLVQIFSPHRGLPQLSAMRMLRYSIFLMKFMFVIVYRSTYEYGDADAMSRLPVESERMTQMDSTEMHLHSRPGATPPNVVNIATENEKCNELKTLLEVLNGKRKIPKNSGKLEEKVFGHRSL